MRPITTLRIAALIICLCTGFLARAQPIPEEPRVGLVLSGGGAKSLAQIGALHVMDSLGIRIDYISGTSMGAIVGSLYALGFPVHDIERVLRHTDWESLLSNGVPRNRLGYFDRKAEARYLLNFAIKDGKPQLPSGFNYSQYILKRLSHLTQRSYQYDSFRNFPIPFLCVATDLESGELRIFEEGRLLDALRASSAFPSLFTPYELEGRLYVDGGVLNNYPVQPLYHRGANYIIGVDVQEVLYQKEDLQSVVNILEQTSSFIKAEANRVQLENTHLLIKPDLDGYGMVSFDAFSILLEAGKQAAREKIPELLALKAAQTRQPVHRQPEVVLPLEEFYVDSISISGNERTTDNFILGKLRLRPEDMVTSDKLERGLDQLYGSKHYDAIDYTLQPADSGYVLHVNVKENESLSLFRLGLNYNDDFKSALLLNYTKRNLFFKNSRLSLDVAISENPRIHFDYFVDRGFVPTLGMRMRAMRFQTRLYSNLRPITELQITDLAGEVFIQSTLYDALAVGGGVQLQSIGISEPLDVVGLTDTYRSYINYFGYIDFDSFNHASYPTAGQKLSLGGRLISFQRNFQEFFEPSSIFDVQLSQAFHVGSRVSGTFSLTGIATIGPGFENELAYNVYLGSMGKEYPNYMHPFIGYRLMELVGRNAVILRTDLYLEVFKDHFLCLRGNAGGLQPSLDLLFNSDVVLDGYSIGYSYNSPVGPLELHLAGSTNHPNLYTYLSLGYWF